MMTPEEMRRESLRKQAALRPLVKALAAAAPPAVAPIVVKPEVRREKCAYCRTVSEVTSRTCPNCGAPRG